MLVNSFWSIKTRALGRTLFSLYIVSLVFWAFSSISRPCCLFGIIVNSDELAGALEVSLRNKIAKLLMFWSWATEAVLKNPYSCGHCEIFNVFPLLSNPMRMFFLPFARSPQRGSNTFFLVFYSQWVCPTQWEIFSVLCPSTSL